MKAALRIQRIPRADPFSPCGKSSPTETTLKGLGLVTTFRAYASDHEAWKRMSSIGVMMCVERDLEITDPWFVSV